MKRSFRSLLTLLLTLALFSAPVLSASAAYSGKLEVVCGVCGETFEAEIDTCDDSCHYVCHQKCPKCGDEQTWKLKDAPCEAHSYNASHVCAVCGYVCTHSSTSVSYSWSGQNCTGEEKCRFCGEVVASELVPAAYVKDTDASCTKAETGHYAAAFADPAFTDQTTGAGSVTRGSALGHSYSTPAYSWNGQKCTASAHCSRCEDDPTETRSGTYVRDTAATCEKAETGHYTVTFSNAVFSSQSTAAGSVTKGSPKGHSYKISYTWAAATCTAEEKCSACGDVSASEQVPAVYVKDTDAACEKAETGHYTAAFADPTFTDQATRVGSTTRGNALGHSYGAVKYTWNGQKCAAEKVCSRCGNKVTETVTAAYVKDTAATCEKAETGHYSAAFSKSGFVTQTTRVGSVEKGQPLGHKYETTYTWNGGSCTARKACTRCNRLEAAETRSGTYLKDTDATCTKAETGHYKVTFENSLFTAQTTKPGSSTRGSALGHSFGAVKYAWNGQKCTAEKVCSRCGDKVAETVTGTYVKDTAATCEKAETGHYTVSFTKEGFVSQTTARGSVEKGKALGHKFETTYTWNDFSCTARKACSVCRKEEATETAIGTYIKDKDATCEKAELGHYKVTFENSAFKAQTTEKESATLGEPLGHQYANPVYTWAKQECTARTSCSRCQHEVSEKVIGTYKRDTAATCTVAEAGHYEAVFHSPQFTFRTTPIGSVVKGEPKGHSFQVLYTWEDMDCTGQKICASCGYCDATETVRGEYVMDSPTACTSAEKGHYEAHFHGSDFNDQATMASSVTKGTALGHKWGEWTVTKEATRRETGTKERLCQTCGAKERVSFNKDSAAMALWIAVIISLLALAGSVFLVLMLIRRRREEAAEAAGLAGTAEAAEAAGLAGAAEAAEVAEVSEAAGAAEAAEVAGAAEAADITEFSAEAADVAETAEAADITEFSAEAAEAAEVSEAAGAAEAAEVAEAAEAADIAEATDAAETAETESVLSESEFDEFYVSDR